MAGRAVQWRRCLNEEWARSSYGCEIGEGAYEVVSRRSMRWSVGASDQAWIGCGLAVIRVWREVTLSPPPFTLPAVHPLHVLRLDALRRLVEAHLLVPPQPHKARQRVPQLPPVPLGACVVSSWSVQEREEEMGKAVRVVRGGVLG